MSVCQIDIFISHAWDHNDHYETLAKWIFNETSSVDSIGLAFNDHSIPKNNPIHNANNSTQLQSAIFNQINKSDVIVIPTGMYINYSNWIQKEIAGAQSYQKPILAVTPRGQVKESSIVLNNANAHVGWTKQSVINAIWDLYSNKT